MKTENNADRSEREMLLYLCEEAVESKTDRGWLKTMFANHLQHHSKLEIGLFLVIVTAVLALILL